MQIGLIPPYCWNTPQRTTVYKKCDNHQMEPSFNSFKTQWNMRGERIYYNVMRQKVQGRDVHHIFLNSSNNFPCWMVIIRPHQAKQFYPSSDQGTAAGRDAQWPLPPPVQWAGPRQYPASSPALRQLCACHLKPPRQEEWRQDPDPSMLGKLLAPFCHRPCPVQNQRQLQPQHRDWVPKNWSQSHQWSIDFVSWSLTSIKMKTQGIVLYCAKGTWNYLEFDNFTKCGTFLNGTM